MREPRHGRVLMRLLPFRIGRELFEPAWQDLRHEYLLQRQNPRPWPLGVALAGRYALRVMVLAADCWRIWLIELPQRGRRRAFASRVRRSHLPHKEPMTMVLYLVRHALRQLRHEPAFTVAALLTLALGVGANVAVFAVVEALLLRPFPYPDSNELVILNHRDERTGRTKEFIAIGDYVDLVARQSAFEAIAGYGGGQATIYGLGDPFRVDVLQAGPRLLDVLGVRPELGRALEAEDSRPGASPVMLLGHDEWISHFGGDAGVIGRAVRINEQDCQIVGVLPPGFGFPPTRRIDVVVPITIPLEPPSSRKSAWIFAVARLKPTVTIETARADLRVVSRDLERQYPQSNQASMYFPVPLRDALLGDTRPALLLLVAAVAAVLFIACVNVANLLLARSLSRRQEMAVRLALGAGHGRIAAQMLAENLVLSVVAGSFAITIAAWGTRALVRLLPRSGYLPALADVHINGAVLTFTICVVVATALVFGMVAAIAVRFQEPTATLSAQGRVTMSPIARRLSAALVVIEVAFAIVLLTGAGLILRSFAGLLSVDPGFQTDGVMTTEIQLPTERYHEVEARDVFYRRAFEELRALKGVETAGAAVVVPLTGNNWTTSFERPENPTPDGERPPEVGWQLASRGFFEALRIPLIAGRLFDHRERPDGAPTVIVSEAIEKRFFPNESAVGRRVQVGNAQFEIVGVVGNIRRAGLQDEPRADLYFPFERGPGGSVTLFVRSSGDPTKSLGAIETALRSIEPQIAFLGSRTLAEVASESVRLTKLVLFLLGIFAVTAMALAAVGIYGVMSYTVRQRSREIGMRIALGATRTRILWLVFREGVLVATVGSVVGLATGAAASRLLDTTLYNVSPTDPIILALAVITLITTVLTACYIPARRAASIDPVRTLAVR